MLRRDWENQLIICSAPLILRGDKMSKRIVLLILVIVLLLPSVLYADIDTLWTRIYGENGGNNTAYSVIEAPDEGYIFTGYDAATQSLFIRKLSSFGDLLWMRTYPQMGLFSSGVFIESAGSGNYIIVGDIGGNILLLKVNGEGDSLGVRIYDFGGIEYGKCVRRTLDCGYIIAGSTDAYGSDDDMLLIKTDSLGEIEWTQTYGEDGEDVAYGVELTDDGGYILVGGGSYASMVRLDSVGNVITKRNDGSYFYSIIKAPHNTFVVAGERLQWGNPVIYIMETDDQLIRLNYRAYSSSGWSEAMSISPTMDNLGYILGGYRNGYWFHSEIYIMRLNTFFDKIWDYSMGGEMEDHCYDVKQTSDGFYIACGDYNEDGILMKVGLVQDVVSGDNTNIPNNYITLTSYPNPFNTSTEIKYYLPQEAEIKLEVFNLLGRRVEVLYDGKQKAGYHNINWKAKDLPSGIYFCKLTSAGKSIIKKMTLLK